MNENRIKVLYIAGMSRSGSTILSKILGEIDGFFNAGELIDIWDRGLASDGKCGCGMKISKCEVWRAALDKAFGSQGRIDIQKMVNLRDSACHAKYVPWLMLKPGTESKLKARLNEYLRNLENLYQAIQSITNSRIIVDSSKNIGYAHILTMIPMIDLYVVHLIRDPRATAYSWLRKKEGWWRKTPLDSSVLWNMRNIVTEIFRKKLAGNYIRLYYEDFIAKPQRAVKSILELVQENPVHLPFVTEQDVELGFNHTIFGNPNRLQRGIVKLRLDDEWKGMKKMDRFTVNILSWPLLVLYGYAGITRPLRNIFR